MDGGGWLEGEEGGVEFGYEGGGEGVEGFGVVEGDCNGWLVSGWWKGGK